MQWLIQNGLITDDQRGDTAAILRSLSDWLDHFEETTFGT